MNEHVWIQLTHLLTAFFSVLAAMWQSLIEMDTELFPHLRVSCRNKGLVLHHAGTAAVMRYLYER